MYLSLVYYCYLLGAFKPSIPLLPMLKEKKNNPCSSQMKYYPTTHNGEPIKSFQGPYGKDTFENIAKYPMYLEKASQGTFICIAHCVHRGNSKFFPEQ